MKKRVLGYLMGAAVAGLAALTLTSCGQDKDVFHIYAWNDEFQGFFNKYLTDENKNLDKDHKVKVDTYHLNGKEVKWTIVPSENGQYQEALDNALEANAKAKKSEKVDLFLAEADYILKYTDSDFTQDVTKIGVTDFSNIYNYTKEAASSKAGVVKGVSFQCCPAGVIYRRSYAKAVLGDDDPDFVQSKIDSWEKFDAVAAQMKEAGYYMTASYAEDFRAFSNNVSKPWVDANNKLQMDAQITTWMNQADEYMKKGYTLPEGIWDDGCTKEMYKDGKAFCYFGPAWYYNFCMGNAQDPDKGCFGDWGLVEGPAKYFWGGTWLLAPAGGSNDDLTAKVMNTFINDEDVCYSLVEKEGQFSNNQKANKKYADTGKGNAFLGGQNDTALYLELAKGIKFQNITIYDQYCNEGLQTNYADYLKGTITKEKAIANFKDYIERTCTGVKA